MLMTAKRTTRGFLMMASLLALTGCMGDQAYVSNMNDNADGFGEWRILISTRADTDLRYMRKKNPALFDITLNKIKCV